MRFSINDSGTFDLNIFAESDVSCFLHYMIKTVSEQESVNILRTFNPTDIWHKERCRMLINKIPAIKAKIISAIEYTKDITSLHQYLEECLNFEFDASFASA